MASRTLTFVVFSCIIFYATCIEIDYKGPRYVEEGSTFTIKCTLSDGYQLKWTKDLKKLEGPEYDQRVEVMGHSESQISYLTVHAAMPNHTGQYRCYSFDLLNYHQISVVFNLSASDQTSSQWVLELNKPKSIPCPLSYDTSANITWFKGNTVLNVTNTRYSLWENNTLFIEKAVDEDAGVYTCVIGYGSPNAKNISYTLTTRARVQSFPKSMNMVQGDRLKLNCTVYGYPVPTITWLKDDTPLSDLNLTSRIKLSPDSRNVSDAILVIEHLEDDDRANYYCVASNDVNTVNTTVMVRVKDKLAALWPFLGILAEVAVLCTIIFIYEKRRAKQEYDESDTDQNNENKPVSDQKEKDVRQRK